MVNANPLFSGLSKEQRTAGLSRTNFGAQSFPKSSLEKVSEGKMNHSQESCDFKAGRKVSAENSFGPSHHDIGCITELLQEYSLNSCASLFRKEEIDPEVFTMLQPEDLESLGISDSHKINKILRAIEEFKSHRMK